MAVQDQTYFTVAIKNPTECTRFAPESGDAEAEDDGGRGPALSGLQQDQQPRVQVILEWVAVSLIRRIFPMSFLKFFNIVCFAGTSL